MAGTVPPQTGPSSRWSGPALAAAGDPEVAAKQQAYMKSEMPYHGLPAPRLKAVLRPLLTGWRPESREQWEATILALWDEATHRSSGTPPWRSPGTGEPTPGVTRRRWGCGDTWSSRGAWWDVVDETATHLVGDVLRDHRTETEPVVRAWATDDDLWVRRTAVICQVGHRRDTDPDLLRHCVEANVADPTFWLRKAVGWALRDYARTDPDWVRAEVARLGDRLSGLSRREATKHL